MRLNEFRQLSAPAQKKEVERARKEIATAYKELCRLGRWNENVIEELEERGETILWKRNQKRNKQ